MYLVTLHYQYFIPFLRCKRSVTEKVFSKLSVVTYHIEVSLKMYFMKSVIQ